MLPFEVPRLTTDLPVRVFPGVWKLLYFLRLTSWDGSPSLSLLSLFILIFFSNSFRRQWAAFLGAWCPLPAFGSCFVEFTQRSNVLWMNLWGESGLPVLFLHHLRTAPSNAFLVICICSLLLSWLLVLILYLCVDAFLPRLLYVYLYWWSFSFSFPISSCGLIFPPREVSLAFVVKLVWWYWILLAFACL